MKLDYCIIGGVALAPYNFSRSTEDVDFLISMRAFKTIKEELIGKGYTFVPGSTKNMYYHIGTKKVKIYILIEGDHNGSQIMPNPTEVRQKIGGVWYLSLKELIKFKILASRPQDKSDVQRLIVENDLKRSFGEDLGDQAQIFFIWYDER